MGFSVASSERAALCDLFVEVGPDEPTLCADWTTRDLAAHLVIRDRRPDTMPGILLKPFAGYTAKVQAGVAAKDWAEIVELVRTGPPFYNPMSLSPLNEAANSTEYFVHHEDVRRGRPGWSARPPHAERDEVLWGNVGKVGKLAYRKSPVGIVVRRPDGAERTLKKGPRAITITGEPGELLLHAFGRNEVVVEFDGEQADIEAVQAISRGI